MPSLKNTMQAKVIVTAAASVVSCGLMMCINKTGLLGSMYSAAEVLIGTPFQMQFPLFSEGGVRQLAKDYGLHYLGSVGMDPVGFVFGSCIPAVIEHFFHRH